MRFVILAMALVGCGKFAPEVKTKSEVDAKADAHVHGEVKTEHTFVFKIDVSGCAGLEGPSQSTCITETVKALGDLSKVIKEAMEEAKKTKGGADAGE